MLGTYCIVVLKYNFPTLKDLVIIKYAKNNEY